MASDLVQRAAAICGSDNPNSDQLAAWLEDRADGLVVECFFDGIRSKAWRVSYGIWREWQPTVLDCLSAAVVEVDRIEQEARKP